MTSFTVWLMLCKWEDARPRGQCNMWPSLIIKDNIVVSHTIQHLYLYLLSYCKFLISFYLYFFTCILILCRCVLSFCVINKYVCMYMYVYIPSQFLMSCNMSPNLKFLQLPIAAKTTAYVIRAIFEHWLEQSVRSCQFHTFRSSLPVPA